MLWPAVTAGRSAEPPVPGSADAGVNAKPTRCPVPHPLSRGGGGTRPPAGRTKRFRLNVPSVTGVP